MKQSELLNQKQKEHLWPNHLLYYSNPLPLDRGEDMYVWDVDGKKYLDFFAGILTTSVGHNNKRVNERIQEQLGKLIHSSTLYPNAVHIEFAEKLGQITPEGLDTFYFGASGTDADETAVLLAQVYTGNTEVIALRHGYSGKSQFAMSLTGQGVWRMGPPHVGYVRHAMTPYTYRALGNMDEDTFVQACLDDLQDVIATMTSGKLACMIMEPIQGVGGFITLPPKYMQGAAEIIRAHGGLIIIDEVQTGFGRTGTHWWGHQHCGITPDIMTMAKGIANGMPLSAVATTKEIAQSAVGKGLTISTFGGNPLACAAGVATIEEMMESYGPDRCAEIGAMLESGLKKLAEKYPIIGQIRGRGLMQGVELVIDRETKEPAAQLANGMLEESRKTGLLIGKGGMHGNTLRIAPPLIATKEHVEEALEKLDYAFSQVMEMDF